MCNLCQLQSKPVESAGTQVLVLGLDGAGKTSLLHCLATGSLEQDMQPTQGFNAVSINKEDLHIEFLESESQGNTRVTSALSRCHTRLSVSLSVCQSEGKRSCGRTGRSTCPELLFWCLWSTRPALSSSPSLRNTYTSCWRPTPSCL